MDNSDAMIGGTGATDGSFGSVSVESLVGFSLSSLL